MPPNWMGETRTPAFGERRRYRSRPDTGAGGSAKGARLAIVKTLGGAVADGHGSLIYVCTDPPRSRN